MNTVTINQNNNTLKMTSLQIAEMLGSEHRSVKRSIERLIDKGIIAQSSLVNGIKSANGVVTQHYEFVGEAGKRDSIIAIAQLSPQHTAILVDRWIELEKQVASPAFKIPTYSEALRLAADQQDIIEAQKEQVLALTNKVEEDKEKVIFFNQLGNTEELYSIAKAASNHGISAQALNKVLRKGVYDSRLGDDVFKNDFISKGYGEMKIRPSGHTQAMLTEQGLKWLTKTLYTPTAVKLIAEHYHGTSKLPKVFKRNLDAMIAQEQEQNINTARLDHTQNTIKRIDTILKQA